MTAARGLAPATGRGTVMGRTLVALGAEVEPVGCQGQWGAGGLAMMQCQALGLRGPKPPTPRRLCGPGSNPTAIGTLIGTSQGTCMHGCRMTMTTGCHPWLTASCQCPACTHPLCSSLDSALDRGWQGRRTGRAMTMRGTGTRWARLTTHSTSAECQCQCQCRKALVASACSRSLRRRMAVPGWGQGPGPKAGRVSLRVPLATAVSAAGAQTRWLSTRERHLLPARVRIPGSLSLVHDTAWGCADALAVNLVSLASLASLRNALHCIALRSSSSHFQVKPTHK
jgi:hypothetical protein